MTGGPFLRAFATVSGFTGLSRILGFVRDQLFAAVIGPGLLLDAWFAAFTLPNVFRRTFAEGAMSAAFVPLLKQKLEAKGEAAAKAFARQAFAMLMLILTPLIALMVWAMPWIIQGIIGYGPEDGRYAATLIFGRIMIPYLLLMSAMALLGGALDALHRFAPKAAAPTLLNFILIALLWWIGLQELRGGLPELSNDARLLSAADQAAGELLSWGTLLAGFAQLAMVWWPAARLGWAPQPVWPRGTALFLRRMVPGFIAGGGFQISSLIVLALAASSPGDLSHLRFADRIYQLPLGLIGIALNTILISTLSGLIARGQTQAALTQLNLGLEVTLLFSLPIALTCLVQAEFLFQGLFEYGNFTAQDSRGAGLALTGYALGIPAAVGQKVLQPAFFARGDTRWPMVHSLASVGVAVAFSYLLYPVYGIFGLALAASIASWTGLLSLVVHLYLRGNFRPDRSLLLRPLAMLASAGLMVLFLSLVLDLLANFGSYGFAVRIPLTLVLVVLSGVVYAIAAYFMGGVDARVMRLFRRPL